MLPQSRHTEVDSTHPLYSHHTHSTQHTTQPYSATDSPQSTDSMPSTKQTSLSSPPPSSPPELSKQALVCLAHALVAHGRLSYAELLSFNSVSDVSVVVRQVRELLRVGHTQWRQWAEEAADSSPDGGEAELSSELSASSSPSSTAAEFSSPPSASSLPHSPASRASVSSPPSPAPSPPNPRRTLTIITRANGKRSHTTAAARRQSAAVTSNSTTYMAADVFIDYFHRSRSLSEAVKRITRDYPSYREVSIYARARRLECRFDEKGRFYQPQKGSNNKATVAATSNGIRDSDTAAEDEESEQQEEHSEDERQEARADGGGLRHRHRARKGRHRKARKIESEDEDEESGEDEDDKQDEVEDDSSSDDDDDMQSESSRLSSSSSSSRGSSTSCMSVPKSAESPAARVANPGFRPPSAGPAPGGMDALQLLANSAGSSALHPAPHANTSNGSEHIAATSIPTSSTSTTPSIPMARKTEKAAAVRSTAVPFPSPALCSTAGLSSARRSLHASSPVHRPIQSLSVNASPASFSFRSATGMPPGSTGSGQPLMSSTLRPCAFPPRIPSYMPSPFLSAPALSFRPLWPPLSSSTALPAAAAASDMSGRLQMMAQLPQRVSLATMASKSLAASLEASSHCRPAGK